MKRILAFAIVLILTVLPVSVCAKMGATNEQALLGAIGADAQLQNTDAGQVPALAAAYTPRLTAPSKSNSYYYSNKNIFYSIGYGMPNCTAYAWGRAYELLGSAPKLSVDSAHYWWNYNKTNKYYPSGQTPKLGAIACWDNPYGGHVAVVEKITSTTVTLSHSEWAGRTFYLTEFSLGDKSAGIYSSGWSFKGYIYILDGEIKPNTQTQVKGDVYRVDSSNGVNLRKGAGTSYNILTAIPDKTEIVVTETKKSGGYTWGKTTFAGFTGWCVLNYCELIKKQQDTTPPVTQPPAVVDPPVAEPPALSPAPDNGDVPNTNLPENTLPDNTKPELPPVASSPDEIPSSTSDEVTPDEISGDLNGDGKVSISDATVLQKFLAGMNVEILLVNADVNRDGRITVADATYIQKILAGIAFKNSADII